MQGFLIRETVKDTQVFYPEVAGRFEDPRERQGTQTNIRVSPD